MSGFIGMLIFLAFSFIWYFPLYKGKPFDKRPEPKLFWKSFLLGLGPAFILGLILPSLIGLILRKMGYSGDSRLFKILVDGIGYGVGEELCKFLIAYLIIKKAGFKNRSHTALLFGAVGLGFGVFESFLVVTNILSALVRGFFCLHVFLQFWMGLFYGQYLESKNEGNAGGDKKSLLFAFAVPILVHFIHDVIGSWGLEYMSGGEENLAAVGIAMFVLAVAVDLVFAIFTRNMVKKS